MKLGTFASITCALLLAAATPAQKLTSYGSGGFGLSSTYAKTYNRATVITFRGKITGITVGAPYSGAGNSVRIVVRALSGGSSLVELGPKWYIDHQTPKLKLRDKVTVTGSKVMLDGRGSIMAQKIVVGRRSLVLRDSKGNPFWDASSPAMAPAYLVSSNTGDAAQTMTQSQPVASRPVPTLPARIPVMPYNSSQPTYMTPVMIQGTIDHFNFDTAGNVFMVLNIDGAMRSVYLGPDWFIQRQDFVLNPGDSITATLLAPLGHPNEAAIAQSITDNGSTLFFRNDVGQTMWAPWYTFPSYGP